MLVNYRPTDMMPLNESWCSVILDTPWNKKS